MSLLALANPTSVNILIGILLAVLAFTAFVLLRKAAANKCAKTEEKKPEPAAPVLNAHHATALAPALPVDESVLIAVLSAAAYEMLGAPVRVVSFRSVPDAWSIEGRARLFNSHHPRI